MQMIENSNMSQSFRGKTVVLTGHTGFKGSWLAHWLQQLGAIVIGISLEPPTSPSHFAVTNLHKTLKDLRIDVRDGELIKRILVEARPDFVFHLAAQSLVQESYENPIETWQTNVLGTLNVLEALRSLDNFCSCVIITSDKSYENVEWVWGYRETDRLGGKDPYSASKAAAEMAIHSHVMSYFPTDSSKVRIASARAGNVIGGGDWAENRIIPDCVKNWSQGNAAKLRNPNATRPWQHVLEPLSGYLVLAQSLGVKPELHGESFNFGPHSQKDYTVLDLVSEMSTHWDLVTWDGIPPTISQRHEAGLLKLNCDKALNFLNWQSILNFENTIRMTADWYKAYYQNPVSISSVTKSQINEFQATAKSQGVPWAQ